LIPSVFPVLRYFTVLCHQQWPSEVNIQRIVKSPALFLSGAKDELVPPSHMARLYELCGTRENKDWVEFANGTHNDTCMQTGYFSAIREFLETRILKNEKLGHEEEEHGSLEATVIANIDENDALQDPVTTTVHASNRMVYQEEGYQLVNGKDDDISMAQSFSIEEVELEE
jgi:hypothetical protein